MVIGGHDLKRESEPATTWLESRVFVEVTSNLAEFVEWRITLGFVFALV